jgi:uncharacterized protein (TIGR00369 family)
MSQLDGTLFGPDQPCFGCGPQHPIGFHLQFREEGEGDAREVVTDFVPADKYQGPPGVMHGGLVMTLADEIASWALIARLGKFGFTARASCKLLHPVRIGVPVVGRGRVVRSTTRTVSTEVRIAQDGRDAFVGDFAFVLLDREGAEKVMGGPLPEAWNRFARDRIAPEKA